MWYVVVWRLGCVCSNLKRAVPACLQNVSTKFRVGSSSAVLLTAAVRGMARHDRRICVLRSTDGWYAAQWV